jgi:hypothetical protein
MEELPPEPEPEFPVVNRIQQFLDQQPVLKRIILERTMLPASVVLPDPVTVQDLAAILTRRTFAVIKVLMDADIYANPSQPLDFQTACMVCNHFGVAASRAGEL